MKKGTAIRYVLALLFSYAGFIYYAQQPLNLAGRVIMSYGNVYSIDVNGTERQLVRRSEIFNGDTIETLDQSHSQIRMSDSSIIALRCHSALKLEDYQYEQGQNDRIAFRLLSGSVRMITGDIGQQDRNSFRFFAGESTVEIRGTDFEVLLNDNGTAYFGNFDGGITITNAHGSVKIGIGGDGDFAVAEPGQVPEVRYNQPQQLTPGLNILQPTQQSTLGC